MAPRKPKPAPALPDLAARARELADRFWAGDEAGKPVPARFWKELGALAPLARAPRTRRDPARILVSALLELSGEPEVLSRLVSLLDPQPWHDAFFELLASAPARQAPASGFFSIGTGPDRADRFARLERRHRLSDRVLRFDLARRALAVVREHAGDAALELVAALLAGDAPDTAWSARTRRALGSLAPRAALDLGSALFALDVPLAGATVPGLLMDRMIWLAVHAATSPDALRSLGDRAIESARTGHPRPPVALAAVKALAHLEPARAVPELERIKLRTRSRNVLKAIDAALETLAAGAGISRAVLEEAQVPDFGLDRTGRRLFPEHALALSLDATGRPTWTATTPDAPATPGAKKKPRVPAELGTLARDLGSALSVQRTKLEDALVSGRTWDAAAFRAILARPLPGHLARRLLWRVTTPDGRARLAFVQGATLATLEGSSLDLEHDPGSGSPDTHLSLAHPVAIAPGDLERARDRLVALGLVQPWKQLFRETYVPTRAERRATATDRFSGHVVAHGRLYALARGRGWSGLGCVGWGTFEGKRLFGPDLRARLETEPADEEFWDKGPDRLVRLGALAFEAKRGRSWEPLRIADVPPVVFSETCRDLDLLAGVAASSEPGAEDGSPPATADARHAVLARVLPALGLGERVRLEGRWVRVRGELHDYKIHLGSASALVEPLGRALVLPADLRARAPEVYLPDDAAADPRTAEIVARVLTLAQDRLVADPELARQLEEA